MVYFEVESEQAIGHIVRHADGAPCLHVPALDTLAGISPTRTGRKLREGWMGLRCCPTAGRCFCTQDLRFWSEGRLVRDFARAGEKLAA